MKLITERLRCDNCKKETILHQTEVEGYGAPVTYVLESWYTVRHGEGEWHHFCCLDCFLEYEEKENGKNIERALPTG